MIPVEIVDVIRNEVEVDGEKHVNMQVILFDSTARHAIVIWVGESEGLAIALELLGQSMPRPMTTEFAARLLDAAGASLDAVEIRTLKDNVYYATARLHVNGSEQEVDARPSDALGLAARYKTPIYVSEEVIQATGQPVPEGSIPNGAGLTVVQDWIKDQLESIQAHRKDTPDEKPKSHAEMAAEVIVTAFTEPR